ncbi:MAG TPA: 8-oxo-dGTP diphosphatase [Candidatus Hydrothermia bacterium]|nr:8-oxo-dGTP diphosphatase [Candidatus Hydrothermia bacterium]
MKTIRATLLYITRGDRILLVYKKRGHGEGKWNGIGGKIEDESPLRCAIREAEEEAGVRVRDAELCGIIYFYSIYGQDWEVYVFRSSEFTGEPSESDEVSPKWFPLNEIPYDAMWEDDREWLPMLIRGDYFIGRYLFNVDKLISSSLQIVPKQKLQCEYRTALRNAV